MFKSLPLKHQVPIVQIAIHQLVISGFAPQGVVGAICIPGHDDATLPFAVNQRNFISEKVKIIPTRAPWCCSVRLSKLEIPPARRENGSSRITVVDKLIDASASFEGSITALLGSVPCSNSTESVTPSESVSTVFRGDSKAEPLHAICRKRALDRLCCKRDSPGSPPIKRNRLLPLRDRSKPPRYRVAQPRCSRFPPRDLRDGNGTVLFH